MTNTNQTPANLTEAELLESRRKRIAELNHQLDRAREHGAAMGDLLENERERNQSMRAQLESVLDMLDAKGVDTKELRNQSLIAIPSDEYGLLRPKVTAGNWRPRPLMRRIMTEDDSTVVAQFTGVRTVDMRLMAMAPAMAKALNTATGHLLRAASQPQNGHLCEFTQYLEGSLCGELHRLGVGR